MELRPTGMITSKELCSELKLSIGTLNKYINNKIIKSRKMVAKTYFYDLETVKKEIQKWLDKK